MAVFILIAACRQIDENEDDLSAYYLSYETFPSSGMRYMYQNLVDPLLEQEVWEHIHIEGGRILSINYDHRKQVVQKQYERVVKNGVLIDSLQLFYHDSTGTTVLPVNVLSPHRFPFEVDDTSKVWLTHLEWSQPGDSLHVVLERRRKFHGDTTWTFEGKKIPAVIFKTIDKFETEEVGWTTSEWRGEEIYAKGIGLVYYRRNISDQLRLEFGLEKIEPIKE